MDAVVLAWIATYLLHSTLLVAAAWLVEKLWSERPERMSAVWKTALVGGLVTATVQTGLGVAPMAGHWELAEPVVASTETLLPAGADAVAAPAEELVLASASWPPTDAPAALSWSATAPVVSTEPSWPRAEAPVLAEAPPPEVVVMGATATPEAAPPEPWLPRVAPWLVALVALGSAVGLVSILFAYLALRRQLRGRHPQSEGALRSVLDRLQRRAGVRRSVPLTVAPRVRVPMAVGVLRPEIVVPPQAAAELSPAHQESLLAHELAHVLRRDPTWRLVALLAERVLFFQPLNRLASARLAQSAEYLCDDWAARHTRQPLALASCLTEIATWIARPGPIAATMSGPRSILGRRVHRLLQPATSRARPPWLAAALGLPLLGLVIVAPGVTAQAKAQTDAEAGGDEDQTTRVVVVDEDGRHHEVIAREGEVIELDHEDGELRIRTQDDGDTSADDDRQARKAKRKRKKAADEARRKAQKEVRKAFRDARRRGDAAPSERELEAIVRRARGSQGHREVKVLRRGAPEHLELHLSVPGEVELRGRVPLDEEARAQLEMLKQLERMELGPMLQEIERELDDAGVRVRIEDGEDGPRIHLVVPSDSEHARHVHPHARAAREHARHQREAEAARAHERRAQERLRAQSRRVREQERLQRREVERMQREVERARREFERELQRELERAAESGDRPTVRFMTPKAPRPIAVPAPPALPRPPVVADSVAPPAPPAPKCSKPAAAPQPPTPPSFFTVSHT